MVNTGVHPLATGVLFPDTCVNPLDKGVYLLYPPGHWCVSIGSSDTDMFPRETGAYPPNTGVFPPDTGVFLPYTGVSTPDTDMYPPDACVYPADAGLFPPDTGVYFWTPVCVHRSLVCFRSRRRTSVAVSPFPALATRPTSTQAYAPCSTMTSAGIMAMTSPMNDVSGDPGAGGGRYVLDVLEWIGNTSTFLRIIGNAAANVHLLVTSERCRVSSGTSNDVTEFRLLVTPGGRGFLVTSELDKNTVHATGELAAAAIVLVIVVALSPVVFLLIHRMTLTIQNYALGLSRKTKELRREKKRSDTLLYQMLPKSVALQLKLSKKVRVFVRMHLLKLSEKKQRKIQQ